jgi:hypothetical protein
MALLSEDLPLVAGCSANLGTAGGVGGEIGVYGFLAFIITARSEKLSRCAVIRWFADILLLIVSKVVGEVGLEPRPPFVESAESARLMRSSFVAGKRSMDSFKKRAVL